jgi:hypothetical protein
MSEGWRFWAWSDRTGRFEVLAEGPTEQVSVGGRGPAAKMKSNLSSAHPRLRSCGQFGGWCE